MAYETDTVADLNELVDAIATFIEANGWTQDFLDDEGTGRRYHAHNGPVYLNMRSFIVEDPHANVYKRDVGGTDPRCLSLNIGDGYDSGDNWFDQSGVPQGTGSQYMTAGLSNVPAGTLTYHIFAHNGGDAIFGIVEISSGNYQWFSFGTMDKFGGWTGGEYFSGSRTGTDNAAGGKYSGIFALRYGGGCGFVTGYAPNDTFVANEPGETYGPSAFVKVSVDAETGWHWGTHTSTARPATRRISCNLMEWGYTLSLTPNSLNTLTPPFPVRIGVYRSAGQITTATNNSALGNIPGVFYCDLSTLTPGQQITFGSENYRVFPFYSKDADASGGSPALGGFTPGFDTTFKSGIQGFAIKE